MTADCLILLLNTLCLIENNALLAFKLKFFSAVMNLFSVCVKERQDRLPTMYWLPKLHKTPYKARFIANSSSCTTTELSKLLTSCLTAVKNHAIRYCEKVYERSGKICFGLLKFLVRYLIN